ncbi:MAG: hypothetical protein ACPGUU_00060 [Flavobacteriaceae bacterium]
MVQKIIIGILSGIILGMFVTSLFVPEDPIKDLFFTKITATSIVTGLLTGIYAHLSKSKLQVFLISIIIGMLVFYIKYLITGHHYDPITMGTFIGAMLGGIYAIVRKTTHSVKIYKRLQILRRKGFNNYG